MYRTVRTVSVLACVLLLLATGSRPSSASGSLLGAAKTLQQESAITLTITAERIEWQIGAAHRGGALTLGGPGEFTAQQSFGAGESPALAVTSDGKTLPDGVYTYQIVLSPDSPAVDPNAAANGRAPTTGSGKGATGATASGSFAILGGKFVTPAVEESPAVEQEGDVTPEDQVIPDDLIVQGSACVGLDCTNNLNFDFDTIILKENNLRILFDDTSTGASYPARDWRIIANDSASGGLSRFSIQDVTGGRIPFTIEGNAPANSLYVDDAGRVGLGTNNPVIEMHIVNGDTSALRLEQTGNSGFTPWTWDIAGNEANFFIRDVTGGSLLPFRIRPGAPTSSIDIDGDGNVGIGNASPDEDLHVQRSNGTTQVLIKEGSATSSARTLLRIENTGAARLSLSNSAGNVWFVGATGTQLFMNKSGASGLLFNLLTDGGLEISPGGVKNFDLDQNGNLALRGTLTENAAARAVAAESIGGGNVLPRIADIPVIAYSSDAQVSGPAATEAEGAAPEAVVTVRHLSPDAAEFYEAFDLGLDADSVAPLDVASVALAAAQELDAVNRQQAAQIAALQAENAELKARLSAIEAALGVEPAEPPEPKEEPSSSIFIPSVQN